MPKITALLPLSFSFWVLFLSFSSAQDYAWSGSGAFTGSVTDSSISGHPLDGSNLSYFREFEYTFPVTFTNDHATLNRRLQISASAGFDSSNVDPFVTHSITGGVSAFVAPGATITHTGTIKIRFYYRDNDFGGTDAGYSHHWATEGNPLNISGLLQSGVLFRVQDQVGGVLQDYTGQFDLAISGSIQSGINNASMSPTAQPGVTVFAEGSQVTTVPVSIKLNVADYNENPATVELLIDGVSVFTGITTGNQLGIGNEFTFGADSINGSLHGKPFEWTIGGEVVASSTTTQYLPFGDPPEGNPFDLEYTVQRPEPDEFEPVDPASVPENPAWVPPDNSGTGGPAGDSGNPPDEDMTKADFYDAVRSGVSDAFGVEASPVALSPLSETDQGPDSLAQSIDGAGSALGDAADSIEGVADGLKAMVPTPHGLPVVAAEDKVTSFHFDIPILGAFDVSLTPYLSYIQVIRDMLLLWFSVEASYMVVTIIRKSSADS